ncbi:MAG: hypothetical protein ACRDHL_02970 [Candidatus Promineifilaceae bacterium]
MTDLQPQRPAPRLGYLISLPERTLRSLAALVGGLSLVLTESLLPGFVRASTTYRVLFGGMQHYLLARLAQVDLQPPAGQARPGNQFVLQKAAGTLLETAGLLTVHFSPLWVFAIAGDAAAGGKLFLGRLAAHLKSAGILAEDAQPAGLVELLEAVQRATRAGATALDTPPLSRAELGRLADELEASFAGLFAGVVGLRPRLDALQDEMEALAGRQGATVGEVSGVMALDLAELARTGLGTAAAVGKAGSELVGEELLASYGRTLEAISREGLPAYVARRMQPFLKAAGGHFDPAQLSWIESRWQKKEAEDE